MTQPDAPVIRAVVFDVDGTLYRQKPLRYLMVARILATLAVRPRRTRRDIHIIKHYRDAQEYLRERPDTMADKPDRQFRRAAETAGVSLEEMRERAALWLDTAPLPFLKPCARRDVLARIHQWHGWGVPMGVYSDYLAEEKLERLGLGFLAPYAVASPDPDVCALKPAPRGFLAAARRLGFDPGEVAYVGDRPEVDARGARAAGMPVALVGPRANDDARDDEKPTLTMDELEIALREVYE